MKKQVFFILSFIFSFQIFAQDTESTNSLFEDQTPLKVKINYSNKGSTYIFELKNSRKIDRDIINQLKKHDISALIK